MTSNELVRRQRAAPAAKIATAGAGALGPPELPALPHARAKGTFLRVVTEARLPGVRNRFEDFLPEVEVISARRHSPYATWLIYALSSLLVALVGWMHFSRIDNVMTVAGVVRPAGQTWPVRHPEGGQIAHVFVKDGDPVEAGQPLIGLDDAEVLPAISRASAALRMFSAEVQRLEVELADPPTVPMFAPELGADVTAAQFVLWQARQAEIARRRRAADTMVDEARARVARTVDQSLSPPPGNAPEPASDDQGDGLHARRNALDTAEQALATAIARRAAVERDWRAAALLRHANAVAERNLAREDLEQQEARKRGLVLRAPVSGVVTGIGMTQAGMILRAGKPAAGVVQTDQANLIDVEARVPIHDVGAVTVGQAATIRFPLDRHGPLGTLKGKVAQVDRRPIIPDPTSRSATDALRKPHVIVRIAIDQIAAAKTLRDGRIAPGVTASVDLRTGDRSILEFIAGSLLGITGAAPSGSGG